MVPEGDQNTYKVLFFGIANNSAEGRRDFLRDISERLHISPEKADYLISKTPMLLKRGLSLAKADALVKAFEGQSAMHNGGGNVIAGAGIRVR